MPKDDKEKREVEQQLITDGGEKPSESDSEKDAIIVPMTVENRTGQANNLTSLVENTLESQNEREETARETINEWESNASNETDTVVSQYETLRNNAGEATTWDLSVDTEAGDLVDGLTHEEDLGVRDYAERQSEQIEGLTGTVRRFGGMVEEITADIQEKEERRDELDNEVRKERYQAIGDQIDNMDDGEFGDMTPEEYASSEESSVDRDIDGKIEDIESEIDDLEETKGRRMDTKMNAATERGVRREETQEVYNEFAGRAESTVSDNLHKLKGSLGVLGELEQQQLIHESESVDNGKIEQRQDDQAEARTDAAMTYVSEALEEIDQIESAVDDHYRVKQGLSSTAQVDTRELQGMYEGLVNPEELEADLENDQYGTEALRQGVLEVATTIADDGYDSIRELREIADEQAAYTEE